MKYVFKHSKGQYASYDESEFTPEQLQRLEPFKTQSLAGQMYIELSIPHIVKGFGSTLKLSKILVDFDNPPTIDDTLQVLEGYAALEQQANDSLNALIAQAKEDAIKQRQAQSRLDWGNGKFIGNLYEKIAAFSTVEMDTRFNNWIKRVTDVTDADNGYAFTGEWVNNKTIEIDYQNAVFLVAGTSGSRKNNTTHYEVVLMENGQFADTGICADSNDSGWAIQIRDKVRDLLGKPVQSPRDQLKALLAQCNDDAILVSRKLLEALLK